MLSLKLETVGEIYEAKGKTCLEAMQKLPLEWYSIKGKGTFTLSEGKHSIERLYPLPKFRPLFASKLRMQLHAKYLEYLLRSKQASGG